MTFSTTYKLEDGRMLSATFANRNDKDGFEISLGMYRINLGPITEAVFRQYLERFAGEWTELDT